MIQTDNVGLGLVCNRYKPKTTIRTFKAFCGSYTKFTQTPDKAIIKIQHSHNNCKASCPHCIGITNAAKILLQSGR